MRYFSAPVVSIALLSVCPVFAQKGPCTEASIRAELMSEGMPSVTDDFYVFNPALEKPAVGKLERDKANAANTANPEFTASHKNFKPGRRNVERIVVAPSGEMAYAYGTSQISFDDQSGKHVDLTRAFLSVWRAEGGSCKRAASIIENEGQR